MTVVSNLLVALVALEHVYILVLEMFLWTKPQGRKSFGLSPERAEATKVMAANQGLYNGFLAAASSGRLCIPIRPLPSSSNCFLLAACWSLAYMGVQRLRGRFLSFRRFRRGWHFWPF